MILIKEEQQLKEIKGDIFELMEGEFDAFCITTNGIIKGDGRAVMGAGIAKECRDRFNNIDLRLANLIKKNGSITQQLGTYSNGAVIAFPTKNHWRDTSSIELIRKSCHELNALIETRGFKKVLLPRPGCGNGGLNWNEVKAIIEPILSDKVYIVSKQSISQPTKVEDDYTRIIVAGGRDFNNYALVEEKLDHYLKFLNPHKVIIVSGGARGADSLGERYAKENGYKLERYPADWNGPHGKSAGFVRNRQMAEVSNALIAFWDRKSNGTRHMVTTATKLGLKVRIVEY